MSLESPRACPVCGGVRHEFHSAKADLILVRCSTCGMVFVSPMPLEMATGSFYNNPAEGGAYYLSPQKLESDYSPVRFTRELTLFRRYCPHGRVLDVGCSTGAFLWQLTRHFPEAYTALGLDASGPALDYAESRGVPVHRGDFLEMPESSPGYDAITFWAVLEHVAEPRRFVEKASRLLAPGGRCLILVPNCRSLAFRVLGRKYRYVYRQHLNYFDATTLKRLLGDHLNLLEVTFTHFNPVIVWQDWRSGGQPVENEERAALLSRTTAWKRGRAGRMLGGLYLGTERLLRAAGWADNIVIIGQKK
jgi:2-polyprenyl-3-methyl-5-hydroxy-6-metoxy-1,4-benzoquinol methylase